MYIISKAIKGQEFLYSTRYSILCKNKTEAEILAEHLTKYNEDAAADFKLKNNEVWHVYEIDKYDAPPRYKLCCTKNKIAVRENF